MVFSRFGRSIFPLLPPYAAHDGPGSQGPSPFLDPDSITPYLGLKARLSQVWINRWTVLLLLVLVRVLLAIQSLQGEMASARVQALSACTSVETMGSAMASMPHYMSQGVNQLTADGVTKAVQGLVSMLQMTVTGVEGLVVFFINFLTQTYLCLITLVIRGAVEAGVSIIEDVTSFLNKTLPSIGNDLATGVQDFETALNSFLEAINGALSLIGKKAPTLDLSNQINALNHLQLPSSINDELNKINASVPTFDQVKNFTTTAIETPFEDLKKLINSSLGDYQFNSSVFPVPAKEQLSFCGTNDGINTFFNGVADTLVLARKIFIAVLTIAAVLACVPMGFREIWRWRSMKERSLLVRKEAHDPLDVVYIVSRPYTSTAGIKAASFFSNSRRQILVRWAFAYATSTPALLLLTLGLAGLFSCLCQYILLRSVEKGVPELTAEVDGFADKVVSSLVNASEQWAVGANQVIKSTNDDINDKLLGWVNISASALNDTLNTFLDKTNEVLNDTFGGTILYQPVTGVFDCLVEMKVQSIQKGITWIADHAHVDIPELPNNTFSFGAAASIISNNQSDSFLADPGDSTSNKITEVVAEVTNRLQDGIKTEATISTVIVLVWVLVALIGIIRALMLCCVRERTRGEGGRHVVPEPRLVRASDSIDLPVMTGGGGGYYTTNDSIENEKAAIAVGYHAGRPAAPFGSRLKRDERREREREREEVTYQDQKLGFAGQRDYGAALKHNAPSAVYLRGSSYVEYGGE
ncbi:hypothetical protein VTN77DRAFT_8943 [Rasamsonia byssochlamydoides]|uniref:uncharacterized protein n=1 Tax=Rasamsonia byssochlamydoides TaxID=89139 RepID=UPI0037423B76